MADVVIVVGTKRGNEYVSPIEVKQMVGRAGRKHGGETATAHVIVEDDRAAEVKASLEQGTNMEVKSSFGTTDLPWAWYGLTIISTTRHRSTS